MALLKEDILNVVLRILMDSYYESGEYRVIMDDLQKELECCGRQSYSDWTEQPCSCCTTSDCSSYYSEGCVVALSSITTYILLFIGLLCVVGMILHIWAAVSAFVLAKVYKRERFGPIQPNIKHGFTNF